MPNQRSMRSYLSMIIFKNNRMQGKVSQRLYKDANVERVKNRNNRFDQIRHARQEKSLGLHHKQFQEEFEELDYLQFYSQPMKTAIKTSLISPIMQTLPPLDITTISYYRRLLKPIYQTRINGNVQLDPHMTHESLHILSMIQENLYPNFAGLTKEFEKDLKLYLSAQSKDIRTMAIIAAGNRILGREKDIISIVEEDEAALWVLFNHIFSQKVSYKALLPYILKGSAVAVRAFYEFSNLNGHESISWFFDNEQVVESLLICLESPQREIRNLTLRIFGNVLGEQNEDYAKVLINSTFLNSIFKFLTSSESIDRKDGCWVLANFCSYQCAATIILRNTKIAQKLVGLLYDQTNVDIRKEIAHIFCYLISLAQKRLAFEKIVSKDFLIVLAGYLEQGDQQLAIITLNTLQGLLNLGEQFKDEKDQNIVSMMTICLPDLMAEITKGRDHQNDQVSSSCNCILQFLKIADRMEGEC